MAKQRKVLPARRPRNAEASLLLRSAESLGRVIGTLQRQLDGGARRRRTAANDQEQPMTASNGSNGGRSTTRARRSDAKAKRPSNGTAGAAKRSASRKTGATKSRRG